MAIIQNNVIRKGVTTKQARIVPAEAGPLRVPANNDERVLNSDPARGVAG